MAAEESRTFNTFDKLRDLSRGLLVCIALFAILFFYIRPAAQPEMPVATLMVLLLCIGLSLGFISALVPVLLLCDSESALPKHTVRRFSLVVSVLLSMACLHPLGTIGRSQNVPVPVFFVFFIPAFLVLGYNLWVKDR